MDQLFDFTGRFHPVLVHLPIGILLIAVVFIWLNESQRIVKISLGLGAASAIAAVATGLLLGRNGDYDPDAIGWHKWMGITTAMASIGLIFVANKKWSSTVLLVLLILTGHLGGSLTHGSGYLTEPLYAERESDSPDLAQLDPDSALFYKDAIEPLLEARCYSCHGETKQKGKLRLDNPEAITKGGKNGKVMTPGNPEESELIKRIDLPLDDEDHMPPKEKKQLTDREKKLISLWIASGSDFNKKIAEVLDDKQIATLTTEAKNSSVQLPDVDVPSPDEDLLAKLTEQDVAITPVAKGSDFLQVNFISVPNEAPALLEALKPVARNVVSLKLNKTNVNDQAMKILNDLENLTTLNLSDTKITDFAIDNIIKCKHLTTLNLSGTKVTTAGVEKLRACENLRYLNIYNTSVGVIDLPGVEIEKGNYTVPTLETDTTVVKSN